MDALLEELEAKEEQLKEMEAKMEECLEYE